MRFLGLVASQGGLFHLPENTFLKKVLQKRLNTKIFISDKPEFCGAIGVGLFAVDSDRLLERLECNALNINPKNLVILIGTNDIGLGLPTAYTLNNIKEILQRTQTLCSNTAVKKQYSGIKKPRNTNVPRYWQIISTCHVTVVFALQISTLKT